MLAIASIQVNGWTDPIGIGETPVFSWTLQSEEKNTLQTACRIRVTGPDGCWDSGMLETAQSRHVPYGGTLRPQSRYDVSVTVIDNHGEAAVGSAVFETGLLDGFRADWITDGRTGDSDGCPVFFRTFSVSKPVARARLYASALGVYVPYLNGKRVDTIHMAPGWTNYRKRIEYQTYDVTALLQAENRLALAVGKGWYRGVIGYNHAKNVYGDQAAVIAQLELIYADGTRETLLSGPDWNWTTGAVRDSEIYDGETVDFTFRDDRIRSAQVCEHRKDILVSQECPPARMQEKLPVIEVIQTPAGETVLDFGQNLTGFVRARLHRPRGTVVKLSHAEVLDENGNFYTVNLRKAKATDTILCSGGEDWFIPSFTFHGFRYVRVEGLGEQIDPGDFTAVVCHSDLKQTGSFACSHPGLNQLQHNILWGQKGNFLDIPTDCPQRDERLGWTGDAQVFFNTASFNMDVSGFFRKWMRDVRSEQSMELGLPTSVPDVIGEKGTAGWGDCCTIIPWNLYEVYGDKELLREQYPTMCHWLHFIRQQTNKAGLWQSGFQHGDWLALDGGDHENPSVGATDVYLIANAFYAHSTDLTRKAALALGYEDDAAALEKQYDAIVQAFRAEYITETGRLISDTQTAAVLVLQFGLAEERHRPRILQGLVDNLHRHGNHLVTGFLGTPYLCHVLSENGYHELAGKVVLQEDFPSWLYAVNMGATTIWERWNSMNPDRTISDTGMTSFNHYAYGSIGEWFYRKVCGLRPASPGYETSIIAPMPIEGISWAEASLETGYGPLACRWEKDGLHCQVSVTVPVNTTATLVLPGTGETHRLGSGTYRFEYEV